MAKVDKYKDMTDAEAETLAEELADKSEKLLDEFDWSKYPKDEVMAECIDHDKFQIVVAYTGNTLQAAYGSDFLDAPGSTDFGELLMAIVSLAFYLGMETGRDSK